MHRRQYGYVHRGAPWRLWWRGWTSGIQASPYLTGRRPDRHRGVIGRQSERRPPSPTLPAEGRGPEESSGRIVDRAELTVGAVIAGPAVISEPLTATMVDEGWTAEVLCGGELLLRDDGRLSSGALSQPRLPRRSC